MAKKKKTISQMVEESMQDLATAGLAQKWDVLTSKDGYDWTVVYSTWDTDDAEQWISDNLQGQLKAIKASTTNLKDVRMYCD